MGVKKALSRYRWVEIILVDREYVTVAISSLQKKALIAVSNRKIGRKIERVCPRYCKPRNYKDHKPVICLITKKFPLDKPHATNDIKFGTF